MSQPDRSVINALRQALASDPGNAALWQHLAEQLQRLGELAEAITALQKTVELSPERADALLLLVRLLREAGRTGEALVRAEDRLRVRDDPSLRLELARVLLLRGNPQEAARHYRQAVQQDGELHDAELAQELDDELLAAVPADDEAPSPLNKVTHGDEPADDAAWAAQFDWGDLRITFADVAGLDAVKRQIHLRILAPFKNPEIYQAFGRSGGGGILLYGPPGCGKTFVARATAGECGARFVSVGISDVLDKYWGESEKLIHALFEDARQRAPTVLFFDEFDALGSSRGRSDSQFWKTMVDQLLQEMDGIGGRNRDLLVFAATNVPWNVDGAFRRPGRFDRVLFVPPPDEPARRAILEARLKKLPGGERIELSPLLKKTSLYTGADLVALCERASEQALGRSLETSKVHDVTNQDFLRELDQMQSTAQEWLSTARNYARYANEGGQYDELREFLQRHKKW